MRGWNVGARLAVLGMCSLGLSGCADFFPALDNTGGGNNGGGTTVPGAGPDTAYVLNQTTQTVYGFTLGAGGLTLVNGISLGYVPQGAVVSRAGNWLYVAGLGQIFRYGIDTGTGALSIPSAGAAVVLSNDVALEVSPDGRWLFGLGTPNQTVDVFAINSDGTLTAQANVGYNVVSGTVVPKQIVMAPNAAYLFAALGTGGEVVFTFNTATGVLMQSQALPTGSTQTGDNAIAVDAGSTYLYVARAGLNPGLNVFTIGSQGSLSSIAGSPFATGAGAASMAAGPGSTSVYVANRTDGTISAFAVGAGGSLAPASGSPVASGSLVSSVRLDSTGKYLVAANFGGSPDVVMFGLDGRVVGKLNSIGTATAGTDPAGSVLIAMTH